RTASRAPRNSSDIASLVPPPPGAMLGAAMSRPRNAPPAPPAPANNPFGKLASLRDQLPEGEAPKPTPAAKTPAGPARAVVRIERKGRGGKEATIVEKL